MDIVIIIMGCITHPSKKIARRFAMQKRRASGYVILVIIVTRVKMMNWKRILGPWTMVSTENQVNLFVRLCELN